ncbi:MAG: response regulator [Candidatus Synoicihabitans palmerolidicus]|nr:response regulator [Candidatus Synoicihabitans palmerolidicus]
MDSFVVDDEVPILDIIETSLSQKDLEIVKVQDADAALRHLTERKTKPLLVMVDVMLPRVDGLTLARTLQTQLSPDRVVVMSGQLSDESWWPEDLRELKFVAKPFSLADLQALVDEARHNLSDHN